MPENKNFIFVATLTRREPLAVKRQNGGCGVFLAGLIKEMFLTSSGCNFVAKAIKISTSFSNGEIQPQKKTFAFVLSTKFSEMALINKRPRL